MTVLPRRSEKLSAVYNREVSGKTRRRLVDQLRKTSAQIGGDPQSEFEKSFASLAYTYVRDRAPSLMDHLVGFQLIDRNDDGSKAAGLFGFNIGDQWMYVPAIFINGEIKGHELLNLKNQDLFVPLKENWVDFLLQQRPSVLGEGTNQTMGRLGVRQPDYESMAFPPLGKYGNYISPRIHGWAKKSGIVHSLAKAVNDPQIAADLLGLKSAEAKALAKPHEMTFDKVLRMDVAYVKAAMHLSERYPAFKSAMHHFYGPDVLIDAVKDLQKQAEALPHDVLRSDQELVRTTKLGAIKTAEKKLSNLAFYTKEAVERSILPFDTDLKARILQQGYAIVDKRAEEEASSEMKLEDFNTSLVTPSETGVYNVLVRPAKFRKCLVIAKPHGTYGREGYLTVVSLEENGDGGRNWCNASKQLVFSEPVETLESDKQNWQDWFDSVGDSTDLQEKGTYVAVSPNGQGTLPFEVTSAQEDGNYRVYFNSYCHFRCNEHYKRHNEPYPVAVADNVCNIEQIRINDRKGSKFLSIGNTLYIPADSKILRIKTPPEPDPDDKSPPGCCGPYVPDPPPLQLGDLADITLSLQHKTASLKIVQSGGDVFVNDSRMSKLAALFHLVRDWGLREDASLGLLKASEARTGLRTRIKLAQGGGEVPPQYVSQDPSAGMMMTGQDPALMMSPVGGAPMQPYQEQTVSQPPQYQPQPTFMPGTEEWQPQMALAQQAQNSGRKEVFDTAAITALLRSVNQESMIDRYLDDLIRSVDRWGRILLNFYWHNEEFEDRYGKQDLPELEDTLRNAFEVSGDGVLFLKQKTVKPFGLSNDMMGPDVSAAGR